MQDQMRQMNTTENAAGGQTLLKMGEEIWTQTVRETTTEEMGERQQKYELTEAVRCLYSERFSITLQSNEKEIINSNYLELQWSGPNHHKSSEERDNYVH